ncbi:MAG: AlpA family phage regulatory protein [Deltaproteobacteria bacterium]|nr:AlpA family phage regulatory protein [Deltaproteobacteria bacterium]
MPEATSLRAADLCSILRIAPATLYRWIRQGHFPRGTAYSSHVVCWSREEVEKWVAERRRTSASE